MLSNRSRCTLMSYADRLRGAAPSRTHLCILPSAHQSILRQTYRFKKKLNWIAIVGWIHFFFLPPLLDKQCAAIFDRCHKVLPGVTFIEIISYQSMKQNSKYPLKILESRTSKKKKIYSLGFLLSINLLLSPSLTIDLPNHLTGFQSFHDKRIWAREYCRPRLLLFQENLIDLAKFSFFEVLFPSVLCFTALESAKEISTCDLLNFVLVLCCLLIPSQLLSSQYSSITSLWTFSPR